MADSNLGGSITEIDTVMESRSLGSEILNDMPSDSQASTLHQVLMALTALQLTSEAQSEALTSLSLTSKAQSKALTTLHATLSTLHATLSDKKQGDHELGNKVALKSSQGNETKDGVLEFGTLGDDIVKKFCKYIESVDCDELIKMLDEHPGPQLILRGWNEDPELGCSALHIALILGSVELRDKILGRLWNMMENGKLKDVKEYVFRANKIIGLSAFDMTNLVGYKFLNLLYHSTNHDIKSGVLLELWRSIGIREDGDLLEASHNWVHDLRQQLKPILNEVAPDLLQGTDHQGLSWKNILFSFPSSIYRWYKSFDNEEFCLYAGVKQNSLRDMPVLGELIQFLREKVEHRPLLKQLLLVRDAQGRTPLHYSIDEENGKSTSELLESSDSLELDPNVRDLMGRTPLHLAAAYGLKDIVIKLVKDVKIDVNAAFDRKYHPHINHESEIRLNPKFKRNYFEEVKPLHLAVTQNHVEVVEVLLNTQRWDLDVNPICRRRDLDYSCANPLALCSATPFQLAAYMGHVQVLQLFLKDPRLYDPGLKINKINIPVLHNGVPALHIATSYFHPWAIKALLESGLVDTHAKDNLGNTALHYAAEMAGEESAPQMNIYDYVSLNHVAIQGPKDARKAASEDDIITCMTMLMQFGLDMQHKNKNGETPTLSPSSPDNVKKWWLRKMATELEEDKNNLAIEANAISVTAALVATASFVGPLQPPLGLSNNENLTWLSGYSQVNKPVVEAFFVFDCFAFYLAIASIVFAMLPTWPIPHEGLWQEVHVARRCVQTAILLLFLSIIFVIGAFGTASIAIMPVQRWRYKALAIVTTSLGVLICFLVLTLSFLRLLMMIASRSKRAKKISNVANSILLWQWPSK